jgi:hypothetical protein
MLVVLSLQKSECSWTTEADCIAEAEISLEKIVGRLLIVGGRWAYAEFHRREITKLRFDVEWDFRIILRRNSE